LRANHLYGEARKPGFTRLEVFGDSFAFGAEVGNDDPFAARLEREGDHLEVLNLGVPGYGIDQMYLRFKRDGLRFHPDVVVLNLMEGLLGRTFAGPTTWYKPWFTLEQGGLLLHGVPVPDPSDVYSKFTRESQLLDLLALPLDVLGRRPEPDPKLWSAILTRFLKEVRAAGIMPVVLISPARVPVGINALPCNEQPASPICTLALGACAEAHAECIDLNPIFGTHASSPESMITGVHWSGAGHEIAAQALLNYLKQHPALAAH
jgi:hypothetical protein